MSDDARNGTDQRIGILTTDTELIIKSWDAALERMTGIRAADAIGRSLEQIVPDLSSRVPPTLLREPLHSGTVQVLAPALHQFLIPCAPIDASVEFDRMQQRVVVGPLRSDDALAGLVLTIEDVTARLEAERRLARQLAGESPDARAAAVRELAKLEPVEGLGPLQLALADADWQVRRSAVRALASRRDRALVDTVVSALRDGHRNFSLLSSALQLLTATGVDVTDALVGLMQNEDADLRIQVAMALGSQRRPAAVDALLAALDDPDPNVKFHAIESLGKLASPAAIDRLASIVESHDFFLAFPAIEALVRIGDPLVAGRLTHLLSDEMLGGAAAEALGQLADEDVVVPLAGALDSSAVPVESIVDALASIHVRYQTQLADAGTIEDLVRRSASQTGIARLLAAVPRSTGPSLKHLVMVLGWLRDPEIPRTLARLLGSPQVRREVIESLVRFGSASVTLLIDELQGEDADARAAAIVALGRLGDRRAAPALAALLEDEESRELWLHVAGALARIGDGGAFEALWTRLADQNPAIRQAVIGALNSIGHPEMASRIRALLDSADPLARESAVKIAGYFGYQECIDAVFERTRDRDESVRAAALQHLPYFEDPRTDDVLAEALFYDTPRARAAAAQAFGSMPGQKATALLARAAMDSDMWVRYFAVVALSRQAAAPALPMLKSIAHTDTAPQVAVAAIEAIGAVGGSDAAAILEPLTAEEGETGLSALRVLGRIRSAQSVAVLRAALRSSNPVRRLAAIEALAGQDDAGAVEVLEWTATADGDPGVSRAALASLMSIANRSGSFGRAAIEALARCLREPSRRQDTVEALAQLSAGAIPWLADVLEAADTSARRAVVDVLGRLPHPEASAVLQRALADGSSDVRRAAITALSRLGTRGVSQRLSQLAEHDPSHTVRHAAAVALQRVGGI